MGVVWHDHCTVQVEFAAVFLQTRFENDVSGLRWQVPAMISGEGDEDRTIVFLNVGKTAAIVVLWLHKISGPLGPPDRVRDPVPHRQETQSAQGCGFLSQR